MPVRTELDRPSKAARAEPHEPVTTHPNVQFCGTATHTPKALRPKLDELLKMLRDGDTLVVTRLDRLGRSMAHLVNLEAELRSRGVDLRVLEQGIDTTTAEGRAMFGMLSVLAEFQRELIVANTRDGLAAARARARERNGGRKPKLSAAQAKHAQDLYNAGDLTVQQIADLFKVPRTTLYGHLGSCS